MQWNDRIGFRISAEDPNGWAARMVAMKVVVELSLDEGWVDGSEADLRMEELGCEARVNMHSDGVSRKGRVVLGIA